MPRTSRKKSQKSQAEKNEAGNQDTPVIVKMSLGTVNRLRKEASEAVSAPVAEHAYHWVNVARRQLCWDHLSTCRQLLKVEAEKTVTFAL